jgi:hypothetical protein
VQHECMSILHHISQNVPSYGLEESSYMSDQETRYGPQPDNMKTAIGHGIVTLAARQLHSTHDDVRLTAMKTLASFGQNGWRSACMTAV